LKNIFEGFFLLWCQHSTHSQCNRTNAIEAPDCPRFMQYLQFRVCYGEDGKVRYGNVGDVRLTAAEVWALKSALVHWL